MDSQTQKTTTETDPYRSASLFHPHILQELTIHLVGNFLLVFKEMDELLIINQHCFVWVLIIICKILLVFLFSS